MQDKDKTKSQLIAELQEMRQFVGQLQDRYQALIDSYVG